MPAAPEGLWGTHHVPQGEGLRWELGPLDLTINHKAMEWEIVHACGRDSMAERGRVERLSRTRPPEAEHEVLRFAAEQTGERVLLSPRLADRPVVARPERPLHLIAGGSVRLYVSTPVWAQLSLEPDGESLIEIPSYRMSDTWFGPNTREGELCYASPTAARLRLEDMPLRRHRVVTELRVENRSNEPLRVARVKLPLPWLAVFEDARGWLWTNALSVLRAAGDQEASVQLTPEPPSAVGGASLRTPPRRKAQRNVLERALHGLLR